MKVVDGRNSPQGYAPQRASCEWPGICARSVPRHREDPRRCVDPGLHEAKGRRLRSLAPGTNRSLPTPAVSVPPCGLKESLEDAVQMGSRGRLPRDERDKPEPALFEAPVNRVVIAREL